MPAESSPSLTKVCQALRQFEPTRVVASGRRQAAVAMVLRESEQGLQVLFIERALHPGDIWSGHLAFPGGSLDPGDPGPRQAAERETAEEVGLDLVAGAEHLGRLGDVDGTPLEMVISAHVYRLTVEPALRIDTREVQQAFWFPLAGLLDTANHLEWQSPLGLRPAVRLLPPDRPLLWGLTYRYVREFCGLLGHELP